MKNIKIKRIVAYCIDFFIISFLCTLIGRINFLNPMHNQYDKAMKNYTDYYSEVFEDIGNQTTSSLINKDYAKYIYDLQYYGLSYTITDVVVVVLYFTLFSYFNNNQTVGKRLLKIKLVNEDGSDNISFGRLLLRSLLLPIIASITFYCSLSNVFSILSIFLFKNISFLYANLAISNIFNILAYIDVILMISTKDNISLHDRLTRTKVVENA